MRGATPGRSSCTLDRPGDYPDCVTRTRSATATRPTSAPRIRTSRAYARALVADVCRYDVRSILAESLHYHGLEHGYHHERYFIELGARARYLLGLCFCEHCLARRGRLGVDGAVVRRAVRDELEARSRPGRLTADRASVAR